MKKAVTLPQFSDAKPFFQQEGVVHVQLDKMTNRLATPSCPDDYTIAFVAGTEPHDTCDQSGGGVQGVFSRIFGGKFEKTLPPPRTKGNPPAATRVQSQGKARRKKTLFGENDGVFKGSSATPPPKDKK